MVVLFSGGSSLRLSEVSTAAPRSSLLALLGFVFSALAVALISKLAALVGWVPAGWTWAHGLMLGCILGGSSSIIIMPAVEKARLDSKLANLINLESALTDALCVVGTSAFIEVLLHGQGGAAGPLLALLRSFGIALGIGAAVGVIWLLLLRFMRDSEHAYPITLSALLVVYVLIDHAGGSAALGILTVAVILGNAPSLVAEDRPRAIGRARHGRARLSPADGVHRQVVLLRVHRRDAGAALVAHPARRARSASCCSWCARPRWRCR